MITREEATLWKTTVKAAWAAGLFEGEGYFGEARTKHQPRNGSPAHYNYYPHASLSTTDKDVLERFVSIVGMGDIQGPYLPKSSKKPIYKWQVSGPQAVKVAEAFMPFLSARRQEQVKKGLARYKPTVKTKNRSKHGN